jgi:hypothetical protein
LHLNSDLSIKQKEFKLVQNIKEGLVWMENPGRRNSLFEL